MKIVIIEPDRQPEGTGRPGDTRWQTNLTDGCGVYRRRRWATAEQTLMEVVRHLDAGHVPAFESAFADLVNAACDQEDAA